VRTCVTCGTPVVPCLEGGCKVRYHSYTVDPNYPIGGRPNAPSPHMTCRGWVHSNGWHMCDPAVSGHTLIAEAA
jgi:hypothetical protein